MIDNRYCVYSNLVGDQILFFNEVEDSTKYNHPALLFVKSNLNQFAALLHFYGQARMSPVLNSKSNLLKNSSGGGFISATDDNLEGSYLHYFADGCSFVWSGKAVGSDSSLPVNGIVRRNNVGHTKKASPSSLVDGRCFYTLFPSRSNASQFPSKWGDFEDLTLYCGFCFNRQENTNGLTSSGEDDHRLFDWSLYINCLTKANICGCNTLREKQLVIIGYIF